MKKIALFLLAFLLVGVMTGCAGQSEPIQALTIEDIQHDPFAYTGEITITGTVAFVDADTAMFGVKDTAELIYCKNIKNLYSQREHAIISE